MTRAAAEQSREHRALHAERSSSPRPTHRTIVFLLLIAVALLCGCSDEQMARMRGKLRGSIGRAGNPNSPGDVHARSEKGGSRPSARGRLMAGDDSPDDDGDKDERETARDEKQGRGRHVAEEAQSGDRKGHGRRVEEMDDEDLDDAELAGEDDGDAADFESVRDGSGSKHDTRDQAKGGASRENAATPGAKANPAGPPQVQGPIKACPENGKIVGAPPPKGTGQWCEKADSAGKPMRHGPYYKYHSNGQKAVQGSFVNGKANGLFVFWLPDGSKAEEKGYQNGQLSGAYVKYGKENQKVIEGRYLGGKKNGKFTYYGKAGRLKQEASFRDNIKEGVWTTFNRDGQPRSRFTYKDGKKNGKAELFYTNGSVRSQGTFVENEPHGQWTNFFPEGNPKSQGSYADGEKSGVWTFYRRQGGISKVVTYENGRAVRKEGYGRNGARSRRNGRDRNGPPPPQQQQPEEGWLPL